MTRTIVETRFRTDPALAVIIIALFRQFLSLAARSQARAFAACHLLAGCIITTGTGHFVPHSPFPTGLSNSSVLRTLSAFLIRSSPTVYLGTDWQMAYPRMRGQSSSGQLE